MMNAIYAEYLNLGKRTVLVFVAAIILLCFFMPTFDYKLLHSNIPGKQISAVQWKLPNVKVIQNIDDLNKKMCNISGNHSVTLGEQLSRDRWKVPKMSILQNISDLDKNTHYITGDHYINNGLGNLMFVYASLKRIGIRYDAQLIVPEDSSLRHAFFNLDAFFVTSKLYMVLLNKYEDESHDFSLPGKFFGDEMSKLFTNRTFEIVYGYMQSYRYFHPFLANTIRREFSFLPEIITRAEMYLREVKCLKMLYSGHKTGDTVINNYTYVGVHVRHGYDITRQPGNIRRGFKAAPVKYFLHAMDYFRKKYRNIIFIIISDNLVWARSVLGETNNGELYFIATGFRETDMALLTLCNHTIMSTGTFSWWSAYLTGGTVIYYKNYARAGSGLDEAIIKEDYFLKEWIPML